MYKILLTLISLLVLNNVSLGQYRVILDADIDSDVDDVEALAMLHTLADQNKIKLIGVVVTSDDPYAALCTSAINAYFGRPRLPVGFLKNQVRLTNHSRYTRQIADEFPHRLKNLDEAEDATKTYRQLLSKSPDESVVLLTIGHLSSIQRLLQSGPDKYSDLSGKELVSKKVAKWICMGGNFPAGPKEANFYRPDPQSTVYCVREFPKPILFAGWEIGVKIETGGNYLKNKLSPKSPVYRAYQLYNNFAGRASWDQVAVFMLMNESQNFFTTVKEGYCQVYDDGSNQWLTDHESDQEYVIFKSGVSYNKIAHLMDDLAGKK